MRKEPRTCYRDEKLSRKRKMNDKVQIEESTEGSRTNKNTNHKLTKKQYNEKRKSNQPCVKYLWSEKNYYDPKLSFTQNRSLDDMLKH